MAAPDLPAKILVDAAGFVWRQWDGEDYLSGCPFNPDNEPLPEPITAYVPESDLARLRDGLRRIAELRLDEHLELSLAESRARREMQSIARALLSVAEGTER